MWPHVHAQNGLIWIYLGKGPKKYAWKALMVNQKIGTSWMHGLQWYSMINSPERNVIENVFMWPRCSCTKWPVMDLFGKRSKKICIKSSNGEPKNWHKLECKDFNGYSMRYSHKKKCYWNVSCGPEVHAQMACYGFIWQRFKKICIESSNGEPKKLAQVECKVFNGTPWETHQREM